MGDQREFCWQLCWDGDIEGVQAAIDNGVDVNEGKRWGTTGLMWALQRSPNGVVELLLQHRQIDINKVNAEGLSAVHFAVCGGNHEGLAALLAQDQLLTTTINYRDDGGRSPIMLAVSLNRVNCFHLLLNNPNVDLDTRDNHQRTPQEVRG